MDFGIILSQLRIQKHLTQKELADELNISSGTIGMWETHKRLPSLYMLAEIAKYFNVSTDYLLGLPSPNGNNQFHLTDAEQQLINTYRQLSDDRKQIILGKALDLKLTSPADSKHLKKDIE